jgi:hypothetical protein
MLPCHGVYFDSGVTMSPGLITDDFIQLSIGCLIPEKMA